MRRIFYLFFSNYAFVRKLLGGRWVKDKQYGSMWVSFDESVLSEHMAFVELQKDDQYITEAWP